MTSAAAAVARSVGYTNAGTIEFLLDEDGRFYFLEMNTRLQVEHPITEMVTGVDLVQWQIRIARGERLTLDPGKLVAPNGHAIECRIYAEDPDNQFLPSPGRIAVLRTPGGPGIRDDSGAAEGLEVPIFYDPMISKLVAWAEDRPRAIARMRRALGDTASPASRRRSRSSPGSWRSRSSPRGLPYDVSRRGPAGARRAAVRRADGRRRSDRRHRGGVARGAVAAVRSAERRVGRARRQANGKPRRERKACDRRDCGQRRS